ncbi:MFS transporter [Kribbella sandramycini]
MLASYREALAAPGIARVVAAVLVCYLLSGMVNLSLLTSAEAASGSYAVAGAVVGAYSTAVAIAAPIWGRVVDRRGARRTLALTAVVQTLLFAGYIAVAALGLPAAALIVTAAAAGSCSPPSSAVAKKVFAATSESGARRALFAISGLFTETVFVIGPLLVGLVTAFGQPIVAVVVTAVVSAVGVLWLRSAPAVRGVSSVPGSALSASRPASWTSRQVHVLAVVVLGAVAIGALQVSVVAHAERLGANSGLFVAAMACGGVLASFTYGGVALPGSLPAQLSVALGLYGLLILTLGAGPAAVVSVLLLVLIGAATGPADAIEALLIAEHTPRDAQSQGFAALTTANWLGFAAGSALAGVLIEQVALTAAIALAAAAALVAALSLLPARARLA